MGTGCARPRRLWRIVVSDSRSLRATTLWSWRLRLFKQVRDADTKLFCKERQREHGEVFRAALHCLHIASRKTEHFGELFLGQPTHGPEFADSMSELFQESNIATYRHRGQQANDVAD